MIREIDWNDSLLIINEANAEFIFQLQKEKRCVCCQTRLGSLPGTEIRVKVYSFEEEIFCSKECMIRWYYTDMLMSDLPMPFYLEEYERRKY